jgi:hypothetical protein
MDLARLLRWLLDFFGNHVYTCSSFSSKVALFHIQLHTRYSFDISHQFFIRQIKLISKKSIKTQLWLFILCVYIYIYIYILLKMVGSRLHVLNAHVVIFRPCVQGKV